MVERRNVCPKCGYYLLAREGLEKIFCLSNSCDWEIESKRETDEGIPEIQDLKVDWH